MRRDAVCCMLVEVGFDGMHRDGEWDEVGGIKGRWEGMGRGRWEG